MCGCEITASRDHLCRRLGANHLDQRTLVRGKPAVHRLLQRLAFRIQVRDGHIRRREYGLASETQTVPSLRLATTPFPDSQLALLKSL